MIQAQQVFFATIEHQDFIVQRQKLFQWQQLALKTDLLRAGGEVAKMNRILFMVYVITLDRIIVLRAILRYDQRAAGTQVFPGAFEKTKSACVNHELTRRILDGEIVFVNEASP